MADRYPRLRCAWPSATRRPGTRTTRVAIDRPPRGAARAAVPVGGGIRHARRRRRRASRRSRRIGRRSRSQRSSTTSCCATARTDTAAADMPREREAWRRGLQAMEAEARAAHGAGFRALCRYAAGCAASQDAGWRCCKMPPGAACRRDRSSSQRLLPDIVHAYWSHPTAWNEIGWGGPASSARLCAHGLRRARPVGSRRGDPDARRNALIGKTAMSDDPLTVPRGVDGRAPDVFRPGGWVPMRQYRDDEEVDFAIVGTGAGGGTLACRLAEARVLGGRAGCRPVVPSAGGFRLRRDRSKRKLYWTDDRISTARTRCSSAATTAARRSAAAPCISRWCRCAFVPSGSSRAACSATAPTGRSIGARCGATTREVEDALKIAGPVTYPWGPKRPRYPYRAHELNAAALALARGLRGAGHRLDRDAARHTVRAARAGASLRLSRLLRHGLFDQRQAERAGHLDFPRASQPARRSATSRWSAASK